jgi:phage antirepressor YoqD-like protein
MVEIENKNYWTISEVAKILAVTDEKGKVIGRNKFIRFLQYNGVLMDNNMPYQFIITMDMARLYPVIRNGKTYHITVFNERGLTYLKNKYGKP